MKHIIIGTAGHVDHGKSTLIRALTGINPDRLKEEQQRGLTIDIGFAYFDLPSGRRAGIVDVPGHEKFVKNMLAGAVGFDVVVLVIAADEGIMPQTREHLNILSLLNVTKGLIALTKVDMVEEDWVELVMEDISEQLEGTFLEKAPIIPVAALKGYGLNELVENLDVLTQDVKERTQEIPFRLPIDRSFPIKGFGTVVTGTLMEGLIKVGDIAQLQPLGKETKIRSIQVHGDKSEVAYAGQRVALNLADVTVEECQRGEILSQPSLLKPTMMLDVSFRLLKDAKRPLRHWDRVRVHIGTSEVLARIALIGMEEIYPGDEALIQLRLEEKIAALRDDYYVLRSYSPAETIGGGKVLDPNPIKKKRFSKGVLEQMQLHAEGSDEEILVNELLTARKAVIRIDELIDESALRSPQKTLRNLIQLGDIIEFDINQKYYIAEERLEKINDKIYEFLSSYHKKWPLRTGVALAEANSRFFDGLPAKVFQEVVKELENYGQIKADGNHLRLQSHEVDFGGEYDTLHKRILEIFKSEGFSPPDVVGVSSITNFSFEDCQEMIDAMTRREELIKLGEDFYLLKELYEKALEYLKSYLKENESIDLGEFRNLLDTSRKYALPLLEHFDYVGVTKRKADNSRQLAK
jgi:selenocysteine-specific elongation factor